MPTNTQVLLASRPTGFPDESNFTIVDAPLPAPAGGEVLVRNHWLSLDPYMRGRMYDGRSYAPPARIGEVMVGATVGEIIESNHPKFTIGDFVVGQLGWQLYARSIGEG